VQKRVEWV